MSPKFRCTAGAALLAVAWPAAMTQAQAPKIAPASTPTAPPAAAFASTASPAGPTYTSAFERYRRFDDQPVGSWRNANDTVGRIGGWQAYAREGQGGDASDGKAMPAGHGAMRMPSDTGAVMPPMPAASSPGPSPAPVRSAPAGGAPAAPAKAPASHSGHSMP